MAPGSRLLATSSRWFDSQTVGRTLEPLVADWQREWQSAPTSRRPIIRLRGLAAFAVTLIVLSPRVVITRIPVALTTRIVVRIATFVSIAGLVLSIPFFFDAGPLEQRALLLLFATIPSGIVLAFPFAMFTAVDIIRRTQDLAPHVARAAALKLAVTSTLFMVILQGWVLPAANQQYRVLTTPAGVSAPLPRLRELTTSELLSDSAFGSPAVRYSRAGAIRSELTNRAVLALMPPVFVWLRWMAHGARNRRRFWPLSTAIVTIIAVVGFFSSYWSGFLIQTAWGLTPGSGLWLPIVIATLIGVIQQWSASRRRPAA